MKIEKVNDNQIRCTLTKADLVDRHLKISELAYGTEKAKNLFRDMMQQAFHEFGFEAEDIPLMIEAIPLNSECIVLIITKVDDPEELDTRFAKFAPSIHGEQDDEALGEDAEFSSAADADEVLDLFKKLHDAKMSGLAEANRDSASSLPKTSAKTTDSKQQVQTATPVLRLYSFPSFGIVTRAAHVLNGLYDGENTLYKDDAKGTYKLLLNQSSHTNEEFTRICNTLSEYGKIEKCTEINQAFLDEHMEILCENNALQALTQI